MAATQLGDIELKKKKEKSSRIVNVKRLTTMRESTEYAEGQNEETERKNEDPKYQKYKEWDRMWNKYNEKNEIVRNEPCLKSCEKFLKAMFAFFLFGIVIGCGALSRVTLHILIWHIRPPKVNDTSPDSSLGHLLLFRDSQCRDENCWQFVDEEWIWALLLVIVTPYLFSVFSSVRQICRRKETITKKETDALVKEYGKTKVKITCILVILLEMLDTVGVCLMVFLVLPNFDPATASVVYLFIGMVPAFLDIATCVTFIMNVKRNGCPNHVKEETTENTNTDQRCWQSVNLSDCLHPGFSCLGFIFRVTGFVFVIVYTSDTMTKVIFGIAVFLTGLRNHQNFVGIIPKRYGITHIIRSKRTAIVLLSNLMKIVIAFVTIIVIVFAQHDDPIEGISALFGKGLSDITSQSSIIEFGNDDRCQNYIPFIIFFINIISTLFFYKAGKAGCTIGCQIFSFSIPTVICVPISTLFILIGYLISPDNLNFLSCDLYFSSWNVENISVIGQAWWKMAMAFVFIISSSICTFRHLFLTNGKTQSASRRLFVLPFYCGVFPDLSMIFNRRKNENEYDEHEEQQTERSGIEESERKPKPKIYACATMWHETSTEMTQLLTSIFRMDKHQTACNIDWDTIMAEIDNEGVEEANNREDFNITTQTLNLPSSQENITRNKQEHRVDQKYDFEAHIFFDDAFVKPPDNSTEFPKINVYVTALIKIIHRAVRKVHGANYKVEHRTVRTPYGGRIEWKLPGGTDLVAHLKNKQKIRARKRWSQVMYMYYLLGYICNFQPMVKGMRDLKAENTHILALDGDVDFEPEAVMHLLNRMNKDPTVGAACGRIHPIGSGIMVWYQKFEYAISHWLQKAAENVTGCVLCSPGCFSLFRASCLIDTNVMRTYTTEPSEAHHYVQYDQGEDRWLCTLLLKQGYRIDYCAESDALTFAPEGFFDFFKQRRRWTPSTMANILDIITNSKILIKNNKDISKMYIAYQIFLFISSILTPGTIFLLIVGAILIGFKDVSPMVGLLLNLVPVALFLLACVFAKENTQLLFAAILSAVYSIVMLIVMMGLLKTAVEEGFCSTTTVILCFVAGIFVISAILHPQEAMCLVHGGLFFILIPSMSMLMFLYSLANLNNINWGTRENKSGQPQEEESYIGKCFQYLRKCCSKSDNKADTTQATTNASKTSEKVDSKEGEAPDRIDPLLRDYDLKFQSEVMDVEKKFWEGLIDKFLFPNTQPDIEKQKEMKEDLLDLRNRVVIIVFLVNTILVALIYALSEAEAFNNTLVIKPKCGDRVVSIEPLSILFTFTFGILLLIQFICMIYHRFSTLIHIASETLLCGSNNNKEKTANKLLNPELSFCETPPIAAFNTQPEPGPSHSRFSQTVNASVSTAEEHTLMLKDVLKHNIKQFKERERLNEKPMGGLQRERTTVDDLVQGMKTDRSKTSLF